MGGVLPPPPSFTGPGSTYAEGEAKYPNMFNNGLIAVLSCEIYVGWITFEREMYTVSVEARNRLDEETDLAIFLRRQMWPNCLRNCGREQGDPHILADQFTLF